jgi:hypothetical protein
MAQAEVAERVNKTIPGVKGPDGKDAVVTRTLVMREVFPANPGIEVFFDFYTDEHGEAAVHMRRRTSGKTRCTGQWPLSAIETKDGKRLSGLKEFAEKLGLKAYQLANIVCELKRKNGAVTG